MKAALTAAIFLSAMALSAHRLDEYLLGTIVSVEKNRVEAQMMLTPGVAVFPAVWAQIDRNSDGVVSEAEQQAYALRVLGDLSVAIDGRTVQPRLTHVQFPAIGELRGGNGEIEIDFTAEVPPGGGTRRLTMENRHGGSMAAYQVNCLVPRDPAVRIVAQKRNYTQSQYELDYTLPGSWNPSAWWPMRDQLAGGLLLVCGSTALLWRRGFRFAWLEKPPHRMRINA